MSKEYYEIYIDEDDQPDEKRMWETQRMHFRCQCGSQRRVDAMTECKQCGAHYTYNPEQNAMKQVAPPIGEE